MSNQKHRTSFFFIDLLLVSGSLLLMTEIRRGNIVSSFDELWPAFILFLTVWMMGSGYTRKFWMGDCKEYWFFLKKILGANFLITGTLTTLMFFFHQLDFSRRIFFGTVILATVLEIILSYLYFHIQNSVEIREPDLTGTRKTTGETPLTEPVIPVMEPPVEAGIETTLLKRYILEETGEEALAFISRFVDLGKTGNLVVSTTTRFNLLSRGSGFFSIVNLHRSNDLRRVNKFFEVANTLLVQKGMFVCCAETKNQRNQRLLKRFPPVLNRVVVFFFFIIHRVLPKLDFSKSLYFRLTGGRNRVMTRSEILGRLYSCGFELVAQEEIGHLFFFAARKLKDPAYDENASYGPFIRLRRVGRNGHIIRVYKLRTMHPYSEYIQALVYKENDLDEGGKIRNDFRVTSLGRFFRKTWIDELPMLLNFFKGELKLVGVRPLSEHYFSLYDKSLQERRIRHKPGLVPPYYAEFPTPKDLIEVQENERRYLDAYEKHPFLTDVRYFFRAVRNIFFKKARSK